MAAVCLYPRFVPQAKSALLRTGIRVATVVNFPGGEGGVEAVKAETRAALADGADEIDLVVPWRRVRDGDAAAVAGFVREVKEVCGGATLKAILETGELEDPALIGLAAEAALQGGADFLKTSTGKVRVNATPEAAEILLETIARHGGVAGFKAAGGVRTTAEAGIYLALADRILGPGWAGPRHFRIGASGLLDALLATLRERRGVRGRRGLLMLPQEVIAAKRDGGKLSPAQIRFMVEGLTAETISRGAGRRLRDGGAPARHGSRRAGGADAGDARLGRGAGLGPAGAGGRQALLWRHRRQREPDAGAGARRLRRLCADDLRARARAHRAARSTSSTRSRATSPSPTRPPCAGWCAEVGCAIIGQTADIAPADRRLLRHPGRDGDGREHRPHHRVDPGEEARRRARRPHPRHQVRERGLHGDAGGRPGAGAQPGRRGEGAGCPTRR